MIINSIINNIKTIFDSDLQCKHINAIIYNNNLHNFNFSNLKRKSYKINGEINDFIISSIKNNNCLTAQDIVNLIFDKFKLTISLISIYNIKQINIKCKKRNHFKFKLKFLITKYRKLLCNKYFNIRNIRKIYIK